MAHLRIEGDELVVELSVIEKVGAIMGSPRVPLASVTGVRVTDEPYTALRGIRVGTGVPFVVVLGRMMFPGGKDFVAIYGTGRTAIIDLEKGSRFDRLMVSSPDEAVVSALRERLSRPA